MQSTKILRPIKPEIHRLNFEKQSMDVTQVVVADAFKPLIENFSRIAIGIYFWVIIDLANLFKHVILPSNYIRPCCTAFITASDLHTTCSFL